jgi:hypothetical protein
MYIYTIILCCPCYMPKYVPRLEGIMHDPNIKYRNIILQRINSVVVLCTRIVLLLESLLWWWTELRTMLRHLNRRGLNRITWTLLTVYNLQYIICFSLTLMLSSAKIMASSRFGNEIFDSSMLLLKLNISWI